MKPKQNGEEKQQRTEFSGPMVDRPLGVSEGMKGMGGGVEPVGKEGIRCRQTSLYAMAVNELSCGATLFATPGGQLDPSYIYSKGVVCSRCRQPETRTKDWGRSQRCRRKFEVYTSGQGRRVLRELGQPTMLWAVSAGKRCRSQPPVACVQDNLLVSCCAGAVLRAETRWKVSAWRA